MSVYLDPSKSARENLTFIGNQAASTTKDQHDCIVQINSQGNADKCNFFIYSTIALPILGFIFDRNISRPLAVFTSSLSVFTAILAKYYYDSLDTSCRTLKMYQGQGEAILTMINNYLDTKRSQKQEALIDLFSECAHLYSYDNTYEYEEKLKKAEAQVAYFAKVYDENGYTFKGRVAMRQDQCQEYSEIIPIVKNILALERPIAISQEHWNKLQKACQRFLGNSNECYIYLGCSKRKFVARKDSYSSPG